MDRKYFKGVFYLEIIMIFLVVVFSLPMYIIIVNAFKPLDQVILSTASLPTSLGISNFITVWKQIQFPHVFFNTLIITLVSEIGILLMSAMAAYRLVRSPGKVSSIIFYTFIATIIIPFHTMMIPLVKLANDLFLSDSIPGIIVIYIGFGIPFSLFLYHGFIKGIPIELEEAAKMDGLGPFRLFFQIVRPLLKPITTTIAILQVLWIWNDFLPPLLLLSSKENQTITLAYYVYFGQFTTQWNLALAALILSVLPIFIFFIIAQRRIVHGVTTGALKG